MSSNQTSISNASTKPLAANGWVSTLTALAFGALMIFAVGFAPMDAAHNAAHDVRHSMAFPCH